MVVVVVSGSGLHRHHHQSADSAVGFRILCELPGTSWVGTAVSDWLSQHSGTTGGGAVVRTVVSVQLQRDLNGKVDLALSDCIVKTRSGAVRCDPHPGSIPGG